MMVRSIIPCWMMTIGHLANFEPMHHFANQVAASEYSEGIFPAVSMNTLLISQTSEFARHQETLEINFDSSSFGAGDFEELR